LTQTLDKKSENLKQVRKGWREKLGEKSPVEATQLFSICTRENHSKTT
jgi:hypothetical protein